MSVDPRSLLTPERRELFLKAVKKGPRWSQLPKKEGGVDTVNEEQDDCFTDIIEEVLRQFVGHGAATPVQQALAVLSGFAPDMPQVQFNKDKDLDDSFVGFCTACNKMIGVLGKITDPDAASQFQALTQVVTLLTKNINHEIAKDKFSLGSGSSGGEGGAALETGSDDEEPEAGGSGSKRIRIGDTKITTFEISEEEREYKRKAASKVKRVPQAPPAPSIVQAPPAPSVVQAPPAPSIVQAPPAPSVVQAPPAPSIVQAPPAQVPPAQPAAPVAQPAVQQGSPIVDLTEEDD